MKKRGRPGALPPARTDQSKANQREPQGQVIGRVHRAGAWWRGERDVEIRRVRGQDGRVSQYRRHQDDGLWRPDAELD
jgi:hypothetical protein